MKKVGVELVCGLCEACFKLFCFRGDGPPNQYSIQTAGGKPIFVRLKFPHVKTEI